jgi:hypothetical protein
MHYCSLLTKYAYVYRTRWDILFDVEGFNVDEACECALDLVRNKLNSAGSLLNDVYGPPVVVSSDAAEICSFRGINVPGRGFTFFPEDESE